MRKARTHLENLQQLQPLLIPPPPQQPGGGEALPSLGVGGQADDGSCHGPPLSLSQETGGGEGGGGGRRKEGEIEFACPLGGIFEETGGGGGVGGTTLCRPQLTKQCRPQFQGLPDGWTQEEDARLGRLVCLHANTRRDSEKSVYSE